MKPIDIHMNHDELHTGRQIVVFPKRKIDVGHTIRRMNTDYGMRTAALSDFSLDTFDEHHLVNADAMVFDDLGLALVDNDTEAVNHLVDMEPGIFLIPELMVRLPYPIELLAHHDLRTWGIDIIGADHSPYTGRGVKVAILDTGLDTSHPDFVARKIVQSSFVPNDNSPDGNGHGTHCAGVAVGHRDSHNQRYGVAFDADIHIGKVLSNAGVGAQSWTLSGIEWAIQQGCKVINLSLGTRVLAGQGPNPAYRRIAEYALESGAILVAAAGNDSRRDQEHYMPVSSPADTPGVLSVGAIDSFQHVAAFSNRAINGEQTLDIVAPGVSIHSSWKMPTRYSHLSGTSMAAPFVSGVIAQLWEERPDSTPNQILDRLKHLAIPLPHPNMDAGVGLCQSPI